MTITLLTMVMLIVFSNQVYAASFSVSASSTSVSPKQTVTISVSVDGAGKFGVSGNNAAVSVSEIWCDTSCSFNATVGSSGSATISVKAIDATGYDETEITGTKSVTIKIVQPSKPTNPSTPQQPQEPQKPVVDNRSKNNNLQELSVSEGELSPKFSAKVTEYTLNLKNDVEKIKIKAIAEDSKAKVSGIGEIALNPGENKIKVKVTAENGNPKIYTIKAIVDETPLVFIDYKEDKLGVVRNIASAPTLKDFKETSVKLSGSEVTAWHNSISNITVVYLQKGDEKNYYMFDETKGEIVSIYQPIQLANHELILVDVPADLQNRAGMKYQEIKLDELNVKGWVFENKDFANYALIYAMDLNGEYHYYQYEMSEKTLQLYSGAAAITQNELEVLKKDNEQKQFMMMVAFGCAVFFLVVAIVALIKMNTYKKLWKKKRKSYDLGDTLEQVSE